jgi:hypothetical protein
VIILICSCGNTNILVLHYVAIKSVVIVMSLFLSTVMEASSNSYTKKFVFPVLDSMFILDFLYFQFGCNWGQKC